MPSLPRFIVIAILILSSPLAGANDIIVIECQGEERYSTSLASGSTPIRFYAEISTSPPSAKVVRYGKETSLSQYPSEWGSQGGRYLAPTITDGQVALCFEASGHRGCDRVSRITGELSGESVLSGESAQANVRYSVRGTCVKTAKRTVEKKF